MVKLREPEPQTECFGRTDDDYDGEVLRFRDDLCFFIDWFNNFDEYKDEILDDEHTKEAEGKEWITADGFERLADEFDVEIEIEKAGSDYRNTKWTVVARAERNGRSTTGTALSGDYMLAVAKAKSRAISELIGGGRVSYEEIVDDSLENTQEEELEWLQDVEI